MTPERLYRWGLLAAYNGEKARGLAHDPATVGRMAAEQAAFDQEQIDQMTAEGWTEDPDVPGVWTSPARKRWWRR